MFHFLSKTFDFLVMPLSIALILIICAFNDKNKKRRKQFLGFAFLWLLLISNEYLVNKVFLWWEPKPVVIREISKTYDVGIVLSGGLISLSGMDTSRAELGTHANRFYTAHKLYTAGKIRKILITGASTEKRTAAGLGEVQLAAMILKTWGVPADDILLEQNALNTRQNAANSAAILKKAFGNPSVLLITSAFHMPRAIRCFHKAGVMADPFPCDYYGKHKYIPWIDMIMPNGDHIGELNLLWHEWVGFLAYRLAGYI